MSDQFQLPVMTYQILGSMSDPDSLRRALIDLSTKTNTALNTLSVAAAGVSFPSTSVHAYSNTVGITYAFQDPAALKYIIRTGPGANYTDTTDTAANIVAGMQIALPNTPLTGFSWTTRYLNNTNFVQTIAGGTNVSISGGTSVSA